MEISPAVAVHSSSFVLPATPTNKGRMFLSCLDLMWRDLPFMGILFFFKTERFQYSSIVENLKKSLGLTLVEFYPFAGRLVKDEGGRFEVDCNDAGVEFVEATVDVPFKELEQNQFEMKPFFAELALMSEIVGSHNLKLPLLSVQVTKFLDGEIVIGFASNHIIADGYSVWHFLNSWTECARGLPISIPAVHMRTALKSSTWSIQTGHTAEGKTKVAFETCNQDCGSQEDPTVSENKPTELNAQRTFRFSGEMTKKLKMKTAAAEGDGAATCTSFEALCAHLWKHTMRARELEEAQQLAILINFNVRFRLDPPLPEGYFGNATLGDFVVATTAELEKESLRSTALRIHETIVAVNDTYARHRVRVFDELDFNVVTSAPPTGMTKDTVRSYVMFSPKFPVHELDWAFGRPTCVRPPSLENGGIWFLAAAGGSVDVCIGLPPNALAKLHKDAHFLEC